MASGGKIIFKYVIRLSVSSVLREKTLNGEFLLDFSQTSTENYRWALSPNLEEIEDFFKNKHNFILIHMYDSIEKTTKLIRRHFVGRMCYWYPAEEGVTEIFRCEFLEYLKVVLASGGNFIFKYVLRLFVPSVLQEKTLNGEFPLEILGSSLA